MAFTNTERQKGTALIVLIIVLLALLPVLLPFYRGAEYFMRSSPLWGPLIYAALMMGAVLIAPIPASPLAILAGSVFGPWKGMLYTLIAATLGALLAFFIARYFLGDLVRRHLKSYAWYQKIDHPDEWRIALAIAATRLMPHVSFDIVSYAAGLTRIRPSLFALATFLGMIPVVFLLSLFGAFVQPYLEIVLLVLLAACIAALLYQTCKNQKNKKHALS